MKKFWSGTPGIKGLLIILIGIAILSSCTKEDTQLSVTEIWYCRGNDNVLKLLLEEMYWDKEVTEKVGYFYINSYGLKEEFYMEISYVEKIAPGSLEKWMSERRKSLNLYYAQTNSLDDPNHYVKLYIQNVGNIY